MGQFFDVPRQLVAEERLKERNIMEWHVVAEMEDSELIAERPDAMPNPTVKVHESWPDGAEFKAIWSHLRQSGVSKLQRRRRRRTCRYVDQVGAGWNAWCCPVGIMTTYLHNPARTHQRRSPENHLLYQVLVDRLEAFLQRTRPTLDLAIKCRFMHNAP